MEIKDFEKEVFEILKHDFMTQEVADTNESNGKNYCPIPPEIILEILSTLVIPVVTALITEYLTQKLLSDNRNSSDDICRSMQRLNTESVEQMKRLLELIIPDDQDSDSILKNVSENTTIHINIDIHSREDVEKLRSYLEQYLHRDMDS